MILPAGKAKIVCTIGPASDSPEILENMIDAGMNVARINFSHGDFPGHARIIARIRAAAAAKRHRVAIMADLPGPKMRIGSFEGEAIELKQGDPFCLTTEKIVGDATRVSINFQRLPQAVKPGDRLFLNDGFVELQVEAVAGHEVRCIVEVGGELRARKGLNLPGIDLGISAFTDHDRECLRFAMEHGVDAVSQSFVETAADIREVREAARALGRPPFIIAKIERAGALDHIDEIITESDGIMVARGDLGVEVPISRIALIQKMITAKANLAGKPVITATQMLESMTTERRPTRAEATDVANAILDGTDCVMLSGESAMGQYPVESVDMLASIAAAVEPKRTTYRLREEVKSYVREGRKPSLTDLISLSIETVLNRVPPAAVIVPTRSGNTARMIARYRLPVWITAVSTRESACQGLAFSYGVHPIYRDDLPEDWRAFAVDWLREQGLEGDLVILTQGNPAEDYRLALINLGGTAPHTLPQPRTAR